MTTRPVLTGVGFLLAPGAGASRDQATLVALDEALSRAGAVVVRMDFPYRRAGRRAPDRAPVLLGALRHEAGALAGRCERLILGGRSMGGRIASMVAAGEGDGGPDPLRVAGLLLVSYPLHPPGRPDRPRVEHFGAITQPCLFVSGDRDAFGHPAELEAATTTIAGPVTHHWIEGKDHSLRGADARIAELALDWAASVGSSAAPS